VKSNFHDPFFGQRVQSNAAAARYGLSDDLATISIGRQRARPIYDERKHMQRKLAIVLALLALVGTAPLLTACYTAAGAGQDLQAAGHGLERSADQNTTYRP
jgi:predicted small secreted protein